MLYKTRSKEDPIARRYWRKICEAEPPFHPEELVKLVKYLRRIISVGILHGIMGFVCLIVLIVVLQTHSLDSSPAVVPLALLCFGGLILSIGILYLVFDRVNFKEIKSRKALSDHRDGNAS